MKKQIITHTVYWIIMLVLVLVGTAWALNIDTDSNDKVDRAYGGTNVDLADPNVDALIGWDDSDGDIGFIGAGRSLTIDATPDLNVDAELYTAEKCAYIEAPTTEALNDIFWFMNQVTVTYVWCITNAGTASINLEDGGDDNIIASSDLSCDTDGATACSSGCDGTIDTDQDNITAKTEKIDIDISAVSSATVVNICVGYTIDD